MPGGVHVRHRAGPRRVVTIGVDHDGARTPVIGIDGSRLSVRHRTGTERYTDRLLRAVAALEPPERLRVYLNADCAPDNLAPGLDPRPIPWPRLWTQLRLSWEMVQRRPTVLFVPAHVIPVVHPRSVVTIHDLGYLTEPAAHTSRSRWQLDRSTRWNARVARLIIVPSEATARELVERYQTPAERIRVIPHGVDPPDDPLPPAAIDAVRQRTGLPPHFILFVGTVQPRKNIAALATAMHAVAAAGLPHHLVIVGQRGWMADKVEAAVCTSGIADRVHWAGFVDDADLPAVYQAASAFSLPSLHEGFGFPALEAMSYGVPTVLGNRSALPEIGGDAALLVDPLSIPELGTALVRVLTDRPLIDRLQRAGPLRASGYRWKRTAERTLAVLREAIDGPT